MIDLLTLARFALPGESVHRIGGALVFPSDVDGEPLRVIASADCGWDHVSVSRQDRCPTWEEMEQIARIFFRPDERAFQLHVPAADHINNHPYCLHWWRPFYERIPKPPAWMVGGVSPVEAEKLYRIEKKRLRARGRR